MSSPLPRTDPAAPPAAGPDAGPWGLGILPELFWAPSAAFGRLAVRPAWLGPFLLVLVLHAAGAWIALPTVLQIQIESTESMMDRLGLPDAEREAALAGLPDPDDRSPGVILRNVGSGVLGVAALGTVGALLIHLLVRVLGHPGTVRMAFALFWAAAIASGLGALVKYGLMQAAGSMEVTLGPGALFPDLPYHSAPSILLDLLDAFSLWNLALLGIGASVMYRIPRGAAFTVAGIYWLFKAVFTAGSRFLVAWMMGGG